MQRILQVLGSDVGSIVADYLAFRQPREIFKIDFGDHPFELGHFWFILTTTRRMPDVMKKDLECSNLDNRLVWIPWLVWSRGGYLCQIHGNRSSICTNKAKDRIVLYGSGRVIDLPIFAYISLTKK